MARPVPPQVPQEFHRFRELPNEIKIAIFKEAIHSHTYVDEIALCTFNFLEPSSLGQSIPILISPYYKKIVYSHKYLSAEFKQLATFMRTCRMSRIILLEMWLQMLPTGSMGYSESKREARRVTVDVLKELARQMKGG